MQDIDKLYDEMFQTVIEEGPIQLTDAESKDIAHRALMGEECPDHYDKKQKIMFRWAKLQVDKIQMDAFKKLMVGNDNDRT